jgi:hypothetical protein
MAFVDFEPPNVCPVDTVPCPVDTVPVGQDQRKIILKLNAEILLLFFIKNLTLGKKEC